MGQSLNFDRINRAAGLAVPIVAIADPQVEGVAIMVKWASFGVLRPAEEDIDRLRTSAPALILMFSGWMVALGRMLR